jgi:hypothetical protein
MRSRQIFQVAKYQLPTFKILQTNLIFFVPSGSLRALRVQLLPFSSINATED